VRSVEKIAKAAYEKLSPRDKCLVMSWRQLGNSWSDSIINSGVISTAGRRVHPDDAARAEADAEFEEMQLAQRLRMMPTDDALRRRESAEHEAAHTVVAQALGVEVKAAYVTADSMGRCLHTRVTPFENAMISLAGEMWVGTFLSLEFPRGPTGCDDDRRAAVDAVGFDMNWELGKAYRQCFEILKKTAQSCWCWPIGSTVMATTCPRSKIDIHMIHTSKGVMDMNRPGFNRRFTRQSNAAAPMGSRGAQFRAAEMQRGAATTQRADKDDTDDDKDDDKKEPLLARDEDKKDDTDDDDKKDGDKVIVLP
jgi:hypothetical protein